MITIPKLMQSHCLIDTSLNESPTSDDSEKSLVDEHSDEHDVSISENHLSSVFWSSDSEPLWSLKSQENFINSRSGGWE